MKPHTLLLAWVLLATAPATAQPTSPHGPATPEELAAFLDLFFSERMATLHVPGTVFVMVKDSTVYFKKGYGYADIDTQAPVDPDQTLFQVASVSKLFTATALMQLAEQGTVDLHTDVNQYLTSFQVDAAFDEPVTPVHLLTHTAGFDERNIGYVARDAASVRPLGAYLADRMPRRALPPGTVTSYSNHGFGLAGHLVEAASGKPFARYLDDYLFGPLGMTQSTFDTPLPAGLADHLAQGYRWSGEAYTPVPLLFRNVPPAGALSTTASDIARFMIAHLQVGRYGDARILDVATVREMHRQQFTHHPRLPGMAYGFIEQQVNGHRLLHHGGDNPGYGSLLVLLPDQDVGFFMASNVLSNTLRKDLMQQFMDRFYPQTTEVPRLSPSPGQGDAVRRFAGAYRLNRYARRSVENVLSLFQGQYSLYADDEGYLLTQDGERWVEVEPLLFRHETRDAYLAFREDEQGRITHLFRSIGLGGVFPGAYEKAPWYASGQFTNEFFLSWIPMLLLTWLIWPISTVFGFLWRRWKKQPRPKRTTSMRLARWTAALFGTGMLVYVFGFIQKGVQQVWRGGGELLYGMPDAMRALLWIPLAQVLLAAGIVVFAVLAWRKAWWGWAGRLHYTVFALATLAWIFFVAHYHLLWPTF